MAKPVEPPRAMSQAELRQAEIKRLRTVLMLPREDLKRLGITTKDLNFIQDKLVKIEENLVQIEEFHRSNKIFTFCPNPGQIDFFVAALNPQYKTLTYSGGNRRGKTTAIIIMGQSLTFGYYPFLLQCKNRHGTVIVSWEEVYEEIAEWEGKTWELMWVDGEPRVKFIFPHNMPRKVLYVGQGWEDHISEVVVPELKKWWPASRDLYIKKNSIGIETRWVDNETGSELRIMSSGQASEKFEGTNRDAVMYDEPFRRDIYIANARGLIDRDGREFFAMTLLNKEIWIDREVFHKELADGTPDPMVYKNHGTTYDNVGFGLKSPASVETLSSKMTPEEREARINGKPLYLSGLVFGRWKRPIHTVERFPVPPDWPVDIAIDFHPKTEQAVLFRAVDRNNFRWLVDEIWMHANVEDLATAILHRIHHRAYRVNRVLIDPATKGQGINVAVENSVYDKFGAIFRAYGHILETGSKLRTDGIILCKEVLYGVDKQPHIKVFADLRRFIYEIEGWMYDKDSQKPVDKDDHMLENWGRLELIGTTYTPVLPEWSLEPENQYHSWRRSSNPVTGY
jgi:hypothetical protein